ncbi:MAG: FtsH protease activity modulator HflK, partial [Desulfobacteria bacterium]
MSPMDWKGRGPGGIRDFKEVLQKIREQFGDRFRMGGSLWLLFLVLLVAVGGYASVYTVAPEETGVIQR